MDINVASASTAPLSHRATSQQNTAAAESEVKPAAALVSETATEREKNDNPQDAEQLTQVAAELSDSMAMMRKGLAFKVDEHSGQAVVTVLDKDTGDVIRQMPTEEALELAEKLSQAAGLLMKTEA